MEKTYFVQRQTMSGIADEVRTLSGDGVMMKPETMREELVEANDAVVEQDGIMNEIRDILSSKRIPEETLEGLDEYVDFYDYDGTLLHRYTVLEVMGMDELPPLPQHEGLICQGWNWTLEQLKEEHGGVDVAPFYRTDTGDTRVYVDIPYDGYTFGARGPSYSVDINWGDSEEFATYYLGSYSHIYETKGKYVITIRSNSIYYLNESNKTIMSGYTGSTQLDSAASIIAFEIGDNLRFNAAAFKNMCSLETITQPSNPNLTDELVGYTPKLKQFIIGNYPGKYCLRESMCRCVFSYNTSSMNGSPFYNYRGNARLPKTFKANAREGFYYADGLSVYRSHGISSIPDSFFYSSKIPVIYITESVNSIGSSAFSYSNAETVIMSDNVTSIGQNAFAGCSNLKNVRLSKSLKSISLSCFYQCKLLKDIELPDSIESIGGSAFSDTNLYNINIPSNLKRINSAAFRDTKIHGDLILPDSVTEIGDQAFYNCYFLTSIKLSENLTNLPTQVFYNCNGVKTIKIPKKIVSFGDSTLPNNIQTVYFTDHETIPTLANSNAMPSKAKIFVPTALYDEWIKATNWSAIASRIVPV